MTKDLEDALKNILVMLDASYVWQEDKVLLTDPFYLIGAHDSLRKLIMLLSEIYAGN